MPGHCLDVTTHAAPCGGRLERAIFRDAEGERAYRLFLPAVPGGAPCGLVLMLHGCGQNAEEFAQASAMDEAAAGHGYAVLYPEQSTRANALGCWNWYEPRDQRREGGEPALLAGMTRAMLKRHGLDARRVHVAGFSAGGAMAALLMATWPEVFASFGVHSGLACAGAGAGDLFAAMRLMHQGPAPGQRLAPLPSPRPVIVFQGDEDTQVNPLNALWIVAQALGFEHPEMLASHEALRLRLEEGAASDGLTFTRTTYRDSATGVEGAELWRLHGVGHAWSGGAPGLPHSEPRGPRAAREMLRFFAAHAF